VSPHFSVFGVPVRVHAVFWLSAVLLGLMVHRGAGEVWAVGAWVVVMFFAILLHELGHAIAGRSFGLVPEVHLVAMGGLTSFPGGRRLSHGRSIVVSFAGPAVGIVVGGIALAVMMFAQRLPEPARVVLGDVVFTNLGWALFNLVPIVGLDGGNMMAAAFDRFFGARGVRAARVVSILVAGAIIAYGVAVREIWLVFLMGMLAVQNYAAWQSESQWAATNRPRTPAAPRAPTTPTAEGTLRAAWGALEAGDAARVLQLVGPLVGRVTEDDERFEVTHLLAWGRLLSGDPRGAEQALRGLPRGRLPDALLEGAVCLELGRAAEAVPLLAEALRGRPDDFVASRLAKAAAASQRYEPVLAVLSDRTNAESVGPRAIQLVASQAFYAGHLDSAARLGERLFEHFGLASDAFNVACSLGQLGRTAEGLVWLERAVEAGLADPTVLDTDADLAPVRAMPDFQSLRVKAGLA